MAPVVDRDARSLGEEPGLASGLDGWVDLESSDLGSDSNGSGSDTSTAATGPRSAVSMSLPPGYSRIFDEGWQGLNQRFSSS